jgi:hypothetical protein
MIRRRIQAQLHGVKLERGHDGFLRGKPEPVIMVAGYAVGGSRAVVLDCARQSLHVNRSFPCQIEPRQPILLFSVRAAGAARLLVLGLAFESDGGEDVNRMFQALTMPEDWMVRDGSSAMAAPFRLRELEIFPPHDPPNAQRVRLTYRDKDIATCCTEDDWVGASMIVLPTEPSRRRWSMHFLSDDRRNDWTAQVELEVA